MKFTDGLIEAVVFIFRGVVIIAAIIGAAWLLAKLVECLGGLL